MPSFSKECLGRFVGFQRLTTYPNLFVTPKLLLAGESEMQQLSEKEASMAISRDEAVRI
jgi:hypothetical protein